MPSTAIRHFSYNADGAELDIVFQSGRVYRYHTVPAAVAAGLKQAASKGEFFNLAIRDNYQFTLLKTPIR